MKPMLKRLAVLCLLLPLVAFAETGLVHTCIDSDGNGKSSDACAVRGWVRPAPTDAILSSLDSATASWQTGVFRTWSTMPASAVVMRCNSDVPAGQFGSVDPCGDGVKPFFPKAAIQLPVVPLPPPVQVSGTSLIWTVPTVANLGGFKVYHGAASPLVLLATITNPAATTYAVNLAGLYEVSAYTASAESVRSNRVSVTLPVLPVVPPITPPANECVSDPLSVTSISWRSARTGRRSNTFSTNKALLSYTFEWPLTGPRVLTVTDTRGCVTKVTR